MKRIIIILSILCSLKSYGDWDFHSSSLQGETFFLQLNTVKKENDNVYFWYLKNYLMPNKFGDLSSIVYVKGDCSLNRLKYLSYIWFKEPMGKGAGERSNKESEWEYPASDSVGIDLLNDACNY
jgi:hypothetical protein